MQAISTTIGFSDHSGWAVLAVLRGGPQRPEFLFRRRVRLCPDDLPRQAYHAVAEQGAPVEVIERVKAAAVSMCAEALAAATADANGKIDGAAVPMGRTAIPTDTSKILASHTLLHSAEGELYREALSGAADAAGLRIVRYLNKEVRSEAAAALGWQLETLEARLAEMGKLVGAPWTKDEKDATAGAWLALATIQ